MAKLEAAYTRELMSVKERLDLRERIVRFRRKPSSWVTNTTCSA